jgi:hypothetical protein
VLLSREATNTNCIVLGLTLSGHEPTIYALEASTLTIKPPMWFLTDSCNYSESIVLVSIPSSKFVLYSYILYIYTLYIALQIDYMVHYTLSYKSTNWFLKNLNLFYETQSVYVYYFNI